jgi:hypothetical protein
MRMSYALEYMVAVTSIVIGIAVSAAFALRGPWFLSNLLFYWVPQACVLVLFCLYKPPSTSAFSGFGSSPGTRPNLWRGLATCFRSPGQSSVRSLPLAGLPVARSSVRWSLAPQLDQQRL